MEGVCQCRKAYKTKPVLVVVVVVTKNVEDVCQCRHADTQASRCCISGERIKVLREPSGNCTSVIIPACSNQEK